LKIKSKILIIAGSDSSGGAGIQADIKTVTSLGSYALNAVTAITIQNTMGVKSVISVAPNVIKDQIIYSAKDIKDATKYERERYGKREFKGKSPLAVGKGGTIVAREGLLNQLQDKFGKNLDKSILNEEIILDEEE